MPCQLPIMPILMNPCSSWHTLRPLDEADLTRLRTHAGEMLLLMVTLVFMWTRGHYCNIPKVLTFWAPLKFSRCGSLLHF